MDEPQSFGMIRDGNASQDGSISSNSANSPVDLPITSASSDTGALDHSTKLRRRAQNRASQRAFRERKDRHVRSLKANLEALSDKHSRLLESYSQQSAAVLKLKSRIAELQIQILASSVQTDRDLNFNFQPQDTCSPTFQQFDAFSYSTQPSIQQDSALWQDPGLDTNQVSMLHMSNAESLPDFENLLNMT